MAQGSAFGKTILIGDQFVLEEVPATVSAIPFEMICKVDRRFDPERHRAPDAEALPGPSGDLPAGRAHAAEWIPLPRHHRELTKTLAGSPRCTFRQACASWPLCASRFAPWAAGSFLHGGWLGNPARRAGAPRPIAAPTTREPWVRLYSATCLPRRH
jgi:hypothetical protein